MAHNCHGKTKNITAKPKTSRQKQNTTRQNQKPQCKNKIPHGKTKNLTEKPNTSQQKQNSFGFAVGICFCREVFGLFGFAMRSLVLPCHEVFGFVVRYFVFAVRFLVLPWGFCFRREVFGFVFFFVFCFLFFFLFLPSLSIRRFWGKRGEMEAKKRESWRRETFLSLLPPPPSKISSPLSP